MSFRKDICEQLVMYFLLSGFADALIFQYLSRRVVGSLAYNLLLGGSLEYFDSCYCFAYPFLSLHRALISRSIRVVILLLMIRKIVYASDTKFKRASEG
jgi:hypothetical protein